MTALGRGVSRITLGIAAALLLSACPAVTDDDDEAAVFVDRADDDGGNERAVESSPDEPIDDGSFELRDGCDPETVGEEEGPVLVIHEVVNGELGPVCFGRTNDALADSWQALTEITTRADRDVLSVFAGFDSSAGSATMAFAGPVDEIDNSTFLIAVDLNAASADPDELRLTMAHEFSHVFTNEPDQLDITVSGATCDTYFDGYGCFAEGSYVVAWIREFWPPNVLASLPPTGQPDTEAGEDRCVLDPSFLGSYAASHPQEDFAESFAAFVFDVEVEAEAQERLDFFLDYPELVQFRDRARASGLAGLENTFERCG